MSSGVSGTMHALQPSDLTWSYADAFPNATDDTRQKLQVMDELRQQLQRDDSAVTIDEHIRYALFVCQLGQTLYLDHGVRAAVPVMWFNNGSKACNCIWYEVVCHTLDVARRAFLDTFVYERLPNVVSKAKRRRLLDRYKVVLSLLKFVDVWVYRNWKGHHVVLQYMKAYQQPACRELVNLIAAYVAWCMNLLKRGDDNFQGLVNSTQHICSDLSTAACVLLASVYNREYYDFHTLSALRRASRPSADATALTADADADSKSSDDGKVDEERKNWYHRANASDPYIRYDSEPTTDRQRKAILRDSFSGRWRYHYLFENSMHLMASTISMSSAALATPFGDGTASCMLSYDAKTMRYCTWTEAAALLCIVDLADYSFSRNHVGIAMALYECAAHNGIFLSQYDELAGFRKSMRTHDIPSTLELTLKKVQRTVPRSFRMFLEHVLQDVIIDDTTRFIVDQRVQLASTSTPSTPESDLHNNDSVHM